MDEATKTMLQERVVAEAEKMEQDIASWPTGKKMYETSKVMLEAIKTLSEGWGMLAEYLGQLKEEEVPEYLQSEIPATMLSCYKNALAYQDAGKSAAAMLLVTAAIKKHSEKEHEKSNGSNN